MKRDELEQVLNELFTPSLFSDYCPNGLQFEGKSACRKIATAVSADLETIEKALSLKVDALITHHGLFWNRDPYPVVGYRKERLKKLMEHDLSLFSYHLPLDAHVEVGNNWKAAQELGWEKCAPFYHDIGVKGEIKESSLEPLVSELENFYGQKAIIAPGGPDKFRRIALVSGGAYKEIPRAAQEGVECFISGSFDEPAWSLAHECGVHFIAMGHTATEKVGPKALCEWIKQNLSVEACFIDSKNPF